MKRCEDSPYCECWWTAWFGVGVVVLVVLLFTCACAPLMTGGMAADDAVKVMSGTNSRGCVYMRAAAGLTWTGAVMVVGTWGPDPPEYAECFKGLPGITP